MRIIIDKIQRLVIQTHVVHYHQTHRSGQVIIRLEQSQQMVWQSPYQVQIQEHSVKRDVIQDMSFLVVRVFQHQLIGLGQEALM